jgi:uncharacterized membrane protein YcjF (UPF0283 family)
MDFDFAGTVRYKAGMSGENMAVPRRIHHRLRSTRRLRLFLLTLGLAGLAIGLGLELAALLREDCRRYQWIGIVYLVASLVVLGLRKVFAEIDRLRKRKYIKR